MELSFGIDDEECLATVKVQELRAGQKEPRLLSLIERRGEFNRLWCGTARVREKAITPTSSRLTIHYPEFLHLVLDRNETHMGTRAPSTADYVKTTHTLNCEKTCESDIC